MAIKDKYLHMKLKVKKSQLPNAGKGLFTTVPIKKGEKIVEYKGEIIEWKDYKKRVDNNEDGYLLFVNRKRCIDAFNTPQHVARYANDAAGLSRTQGLRNNCYYDIVDGRGYIVSTRNIKAGEEIFVNYTKEYWDCVRYNIKHGHYKPKKSKTKK